MRRLVRFLAAGIFALGASVSMANVAALAIPVIDLLSVSLIGLLSVSLSVIVWTAGATYIAMELLGDNPFAKDPPN